MSFDDLFFNHLSFMAWHRGSVRLQGRDLLIVGPIPELTSFVPGSIESRIPADCPAVRLAPWSGGPAWEGILESGGYQRAESLVYMELGNTHAAIGRDFTPQITLAADSEAALAFAGIQAAAFAAGDPAADDWWRDYFAEQATANYAHSAQCFYLGWDTARPVTTTLVVRTNGLTGVYAVATRPEYRRRGIAAAVLERVRNDALKTGYPRIALQALAGSYAEHYYSKLGFFPRYTSQVWRR